MPVCPPASPPWVYNEVRAGCHREIGVTKCLCLTDEPDTRLLDSAAPLARVGEGQCDGGRTGVERRLEVASEGRQERCDESDREGTISPIPHERRLCPHPVRAFCFVDAAE